MSRSQKTTIGVPWRTLLDWYDAWLRTDEPGKVCAALQISAMTLHTWQKKHPELVEARKLAESRRGDRNNFSGYIFKQLSADAQRVWDKIKFYHEEGGTYEAIEKILSGQTKRLRQELFIHALATTNFDISEAMRMVNLTRSGLEHWRNDLEFRQLVEEIQWHKKNFFERTLVDLVEARHPAAVMFVNRTINADRGYGEKVEVNHSTKSGVQLEELDLDVDTQRKILDAIRKKQEQALLGKPTSKDVNVEASVERVDEVLRLSESNSLPV